MQAIAGAEMSEINVTDDDPVAGKRIKELKLPEDCVIVAVRRGARTLVPRGNTLKSLGTLRRRCDYPIGFASDLCTLCAGGRDRHCP